MPKTKLAKKFKLNKNQLILLLAAVAAVGGFLVYRSMAATKRTYTWQQSGTASNCDANATVCNKYGKIVSGPAPSDGKVWSGYPYYYSGAYRYNWYGPYSNVWIDPPKDYAAGYRFYRVSWYYRAPTKSGADLFFDVIGDAPALNNWRNGWVECKGVSQSTVYKSASITFPITTNSATPTFRCGHNYKSIRGNGHPANINLQDIEFRAMTKYGTVFFDYVKFEKF